MEEKDSMAKIIEKAYKTSRIDQVYPQITQMQDLKVQSKVNNMIREMVFKMIQEEGYKEDPSKIFTGRYKVSLNDKKLLSVRLELYSYAYPAAHGITRVRGLTFDLGTGKLVKFKDLFDPNTKYLSRLTELVKKQIKEKEIPLLTEYEGVKEDQEFYLTKNELVLFYQIYEYTPYAYGILEFPIPYTEIKDIIYKQGPLARLT